MANPLKVLTALSASSGVFVSGSADGLQVLQGSVKVTGGGEISGSAALKAGGALSVGNGATIQAGNLAVSAGEISGSGALKAGAALTVANGATIEAGNLAVSVGEISASSNLKSGGDLTVAGAATLGGDLAVNGGDITSTATSFNLLNSTVTTLSIGGAATTLNLGVIGGNTKVKGNLVVEGTTVTVDSTNVQVKDPIMLLGSSSGGAAADGDRGFVFAISGSGAGPSKAFFWDDSAGQFAFANTDSTAGGASVNINGGYANVQLAQLTASVVSASGASVFGTLAIDSVDINGGTIDGATIGASVQSSGKFTTLSASSTLHVGGASTLAGGVSVIGNISASNQLSIGGLATFADAMVVTGSSTFIGAMAAGTITASALNVTGLAKLDSSLTASALEVTNGANFKGAVTLGDAAADVIAVTGRLTASQGLDLGSQKGISVNGSKYLSYDTNGATYTGSIIADPYGASGVEIYAGIDAALGKYLIGTVPEAGTLQITENDNSVFRVGSGANLAKLEFNSSRQAELMGKSEVKLSTTASAGGDIKIGGRTADRTLVSYNGGQFSGFVSSNYLNLTGALDALSSSISSLGGSSVSPAEYYSVRAVVTHSLSNTSEDLIFFLNGGNSNSTNLLSGSALTGLSSSVSAADLLGKMAYASFDVAVQAAGGNTWTNDLVSVTVDAAQSGSFWYPKFVISAPSLAQNSKVRLIVVNETSGTIQ